jgi:hypothetical protein
VKADSHEKQWTIPPPIQRRDSYLQAVAREYDAKRKRKRREREEKASSYKKTARDALREHCKQKRGRACSSLPALVDGAEAELVP